MKKLFLFTLHILEIGKHLNKNTKEPCFIKINVVMSQYFDFILKLKKLEKSYAIYRAGYTDKHIRVESRKYAFFYQSSEYLIARYSRTYSQVGAEAKQVSCSVFVFVVPCCAANLGNRERRVRDQTMAAACR